MSLLKTIDERISWKRLTAIVIFIALLFGIPISVLLVQRQTRMISKAQSVKETIAPELAVSIGEAPISAPVIEQVFPWVGKIGDAVLVEGKNFGNYPADRQLKIGEVVLLENNIIDWRDDRIEAVIPLGAKQGAGVELTIGQHPAVESLPLVFYDQKTRLKLEKRGNLLILADDWRISTVKVWLKDEDSESGFSEREIRPGAEKEGLIFDIGGSMIGSLLLFDNQGNILSYYLDPVEFGF